MTGARSLGSRDVQEADGPDASITAKQININLIHG